MKQIRVKKLFGGNISLRDYIVEEAIKEGGAIIKLGDQKMILFPEDLKKGKKVGLKLRSKWGNKIYDLVDFEWKPATKQKKLF